MSSPLSKITQSTPSPTITAVKLTAVKIITTPLVNHLNLQTPPPEPTVHIDDHNPSPFALRQPLPDSTLDSPIDYNRMDNEKENEDPNDPGLPFFPNNPTSTWFYPLYICLDDPSPDGPA